MKEYRDTPHTRRREIKGTVSDGSQVLLECPVSVRYTSDERGRTLSLTAADMIQIAVALEPLEGMIEGIDA